MKRLTTSNDIIVWFDRGFICLTLLMNSSVLDTVYLDFPSGAKSSARYLLRLYVAVPMLDTIGRSGSLSTFDRFFSSVSRSLCNFAVP